MEGKVIPARIGRRRRPIWFDVEDRERVIVRLSIVFQGIWNSVQEIHKQYPPTGFGKKILRATATAEEAGGLLYMGPGFKKSLIHDAFGTVIKEMLVDRNAWIDNMWFPILAEFKGKLLWDTLTPEPRSKEKWKKRLLVCGKKWSDVDLGQDTIVKITVRLCEDKLGRNFSEQAIEKRFISWRKRTREER